MKLKNSPHATNSLPRRLLAASLAGVVLTSAVAPAAEAYQHRRWISIDGASPAYWGGERTMQSTAIAAAGSGGG